MDRWLLCVSAKVAGDAVGWVVGPRSGVVEWLLTVSNCSCKADLGSDDSHTLEPSSGAL